MAKALNDFKPVSKFLNTPITAHLGPGVPLLVLLVSQTIIVQIQCPKAEALPLIESDLLGHPDKLSPVDPIAVDLEKKDTPPNVSDVIETILEKSASSLDSSPAIEAKIFIHRHLEDHLDIDQQQHDHQELHNQVSFALDIVLRIGIFLYCCLVIGYLCDEYFVPSLESIGEALNLRPDLIGAILIPFGTSGPEIFSSAVGVFFTENDIGTGAIIGSGVFNILAIPAASGLAASYFIGESIKLEKGPVLRDLTFYVISIIVLILAIKDNTVDFIDSALFTILFVVYIGVMFYNCAEKPEVYDDDPEKEFGTFKKSNSANNIVVVNNSQQPAIHTGAGHLPNMTINNCNNNFQTETNGNNNNKKKMKQYLNKCNEMMIDDKEPFLEKVAKLYDIESSRTYLNEYFAKENQIHSNGKEVERKFYAFIEDIIHQQNENFIQIKPNKAEYEKLETVDENGVGFTDHIVLRIILMPFMFIFSMTMPAVRWPTITFLFSIVWLSLLSYVTVWAISDFSDMVGIPPTISGMTILAAGSAVPDLVTSIIVIKKTGQASMGICAAISSNIFAILLGLGLPWAVQFCLNWIKLGNYGASLIALNSTALPYTSLLLLAVVVMLYFTFRICDWRISKTFSLICVFIHVAFVVCSIFLELSIS